MKSDVFGLQRKVNRPRDFKLDMNDKYYYIRVENFSGFE